MSKTSVLIVGSDGFLGKNLSVYFDKIGQHYYTISKQDGDLRDQIRCFAAFEKFKGKKIDRIFNCITFQRTGSIQFDIPSELLMNNMQINVNILKSWHQFLPQTKFIAMGSSCSYPDSSDPIPESSFGTGTLHESVEYYGFAKNFLAKALKAYNKQYGMNYLYCVLATMYGPYDHTEENRSHFVTGMLHRAIQEKASDAKEFTVWGRPDNVRECLYVDDQIEAILLATRHFENRIINCGANDNSSIRIGDLAEIILETLEWNAEIKYPSNTFSGVKKKVLDSSVFLEKTNWVPVQLFSRIKIYPDYQLY